MEYEHKYLYTHTHAHLYMDSVTQDMKMGRITFDETLKVSLLIQ